jgi:hypothetical protein
MFVMPPGSAGIADSGRCALHPACWYAHIHPQTLEGSSIVNTGWQPLFMAEREGFEPPVAFRATAVFKTARFDRSRTSPITTLLLHSAGKHLISKGHAEVFKTEIRLFTHPAGARPNGCLQEVSLHRRLRHGRVLRELLGFYVLHGGRDHANRATAGGLGSAAQGE